MEYHLEINTTAIDIEVEADSDNRLSARLEDKTYDVGYTVISDNQIHLNIKNGAENKELNAYIADTPGGRTVIISGIPYDVQDLDAASRRNVKKSSSPDIPDTVTPPMPAVVIAALVNPGDTVAKGQGVIVISAMKMETTLVAPYEGTVTQINVSEGDKVSPGDILIDIEKSTQEA